MKKTLSIITMLLITLALFAQGGKEETKKYVFAQDCNWPPLEFIDEDGKIAGFEVDLIKEFSAMTGIEMESQNTGWDGIFAGLVNGSYDAVASGVTVTEERKATMDFSTPVVKVVQSIIVNENGKDIDTPEELVGKTIGVQMGTTGHFVAEKIEGVTIKAFDDIALAIEDLMNGNLDAAICDSLIASDFVLANENYQGKLFITGNASNETEDIAMCVKKGNTELLNIINDCLAKLEENGKMAELKAKWNIL